MKIVILTEDDRKMHFVIGYLLQDFRLQNGVELVFATTGNFLAVAQGEDVLAVVAYGTGAEEQYADCLRSLLAHEPKLQYPVYFIHTGLEPKIAGCVTVERNVGSRKDTPNTYYYLLCEITRYQRQLMST